MITVDQLKQARKDSTDQFLEVVSQRIQTRDQEGRCTDQIAVPANVDVAVVQDELELAGFTVVRKRGWDMRDGDYDYLMISWPRD